MPWLVVFCQPVKHAAEAWRRQTMFSDLSHGPVSFFQQQRTCSRIGGRDKPFAGQELRPPFFNSAKDWQDFVFFEDSPVQLKQKRTMERVVIHCI